MPRREDPDFDETELAPGEEHQDWAQHHGTDLIGSDLLDRVEKFLSRFVAYPSEAARVAHVLWIAHTHRMDIWDSTPRIAFLSPEPGSGKTRALEVTELLVPNPVHSVNVSPAYLFRRIGAEEGRPTILYDEIDTVFGPKAKDNEDIRGLLNAGHRHALVGRCVTKGRTVETEDYDPYCAVALAGLHDLPDTIMSRSVVVHMRRRSPDERVEAFRERIHKFDGWVLRDELTAWVNKSIIPGDYPDLPSEINDRDADVWEPLIAVADAAGGDWPERARCHAVTLVTAKSEARRSLGIQLLTDIRSIFEATDDDRIFTDEMLDRLIEMELSPWSDVKGKPLDARSLAYRLRKYDVHPTTVRVNGSSAKGYKREDLEDAWARYVAPLPSDLSVTSVTAVTDEPPLEDADSYFDDFYGEDDEERAIARLTDVLGAVEVG